MENADIIDRLIDWHCTTRPRLAQSFGFSSSSVYRQIDGALTVAHLHGIAMGLEMAAAVYPGSSRADTDGEQNATSAVAGEAPNDRQS